MLLETKKSIPCVLRQPTIIFLELQDIPGNKQHFILIAEEEWRIRIFNSAAISAQFYIPAVGMKVGKRPERRLIELPWVRTCTSQHWLNMCLWIWRSLCMNLQNWKSIWSLKDLESGVGKKTELFPAFKRFSSKHFCCFSTKRPAKQISKA